MSDLKEQTKNSGSEDFVKETGVVVQVGDGSAQVYGFNFVTVGEIVTFKVDDQVNNLVPLQSSFKSYRWSSSTSI